MAGTVVPVLCVTLNFLACTVLCPDAERHNELDGQSLRALDHAEPARARLWPGVTGRHSVGLETVGFNIGMKLAQKQARITR